MASFDEIHATNELYTQFLGGVDTRYSAASTLYLTWSITSVFEVFDTLRCALTNNVRYVVKIEVVLVPVTALGVIANILSVLYACGTL